jgi:hypothetical protein
MLALPGSDPYVLYHGQQDAQVHVLGWHECGGNVAVTPP